MVQAQKNFKTIYFLDDYAAAKFLNCTRKQVLETLWLNSCENKQTFSYSGFPLKKAGQHTRKGWVLTHVKLSEEEMKLRNAIAGWNGAERSADQVWDR